MFVSFRGETAKSDWIKKQAIIELRNAIHFVKVATKIRNKSSDTLDDGLLSRTKKLDSFEV